MENKLRVGVFINSHLIPLWAFKMLERIANSHYAVIVLLVKNSTQYTGQKGIFKKLRENYHYLASTAFTKAAHKVRAFSQMLLN
jgi:hypothetical protein